MSKVTCPVCGESQGIEKLPCLNWYTCRDGCRAEWDEDQRRSSPIMWVTYDGTPETLPRQGSFTLVSPVGQRGPYCAFYLYNPDEDDCPGWFLVHSSDPGWEPGDAPDAVPGDQWSYILPPEARIGRNDDV